MLSLLLWCGMNIHACGIEESRDVNLVKRAGELTEDEVEHRITVMQNPCQYRIPH